MFSNLPEAIDYIDWIESVAADWPDVDENYAKVRAAARLVARIWTTCPTCSGSGCSFGNHTLAHNSDNTMCLKYPCPDCVAGLVPTEEARALVGKSVEEAQATYVGSGSYMTPAEHVGKWVLAALLEYGIDE